MRKFLGKFSSVMGVFCGFVRGTKTVKEEELERSIDFLAPVSGLDVTLRRAFLGYVGRHLDSRATKKMNVLLSDPTNADSSLSEVWDRMMDQFADEARESTNDESPLALV